LPTTRARLQQRILQKGMGCRREGIMARKSITRSNSEIATLLAAVAQLLEEQAARDTRVREWRDAAGAIRSLHRPVADILRDDGVEALDDINGISHMLADQICEIVETGRLALYERLLGETDSVARIAAVPGMGRKLAHRVHSTLGIESIPELERAADDGRLRKVAGFGPKRAAAIREVLAKRRRRRRPTTPVEPTPIGELLDVDREYRERAAAHDLPFIAPRKGVVGAEPIPVLHTMRGDRHYTAMYSHTATATRLGRGNDWVVMYYDDPDGEHQYTAVTAQRGPLAGRRIVRGREAQCVLHYHLTSSRFGAYAMSGS
jgi:DNA polymerase (family X)